MVLYCGTDTVSAYSLEDNDNRKAYFINGMVKACYLGFLDDTYRGSEFFVPLIILFVAVAYRSDLRALSSQTYQVNFGPHEYGAYNCQIKPG